MGTKTKAKTGTDTDTDTDMELVVVEILTGGGLCGAATQEWKNMSNISLPENEKIKNKTYFSSKEYLILSKKIKKKTIFLFVLLVQISLKGVRIEILTVESY